ncbi:MAG TPA: ABC transporter permease [Patescibacteria group bacterium]|nr:ABC transporter permease [Patescibacteria group bacterium]
MKLIDTVKLSFSVLRANKARSFLTSLGIIIGIAAVIIIMSVGAGAQSLIVNQLNSVGTNLVAILPGAADENGPPASVFGIVLTTLKYEDAVAIKNEVANVTAISSYNTGVGTASYLSNTYDVTYYGVMSQYLLVEDTDVANGRFFTAEEEKSNARVAVIGYQVWQDLFEGNDPLGQKIKIKKESFEVIGIMKERGTAGFQNQDDIVLLPVSTVQNLILGVGHINFIRVKILGSENIDRAVDDIKFLLRDRHNIRTEKEDDFSVRNTVDAIAALKTITNALRFFLAAIAAISLIVGGVGVMNIMLAAVNDRIREIGLRKAVGAKQSNLMIQFLSESIVVTFFGGIIGIIIGGAFSTLVAIIANYLGYDWDLVVSPSSIIMGVVVALVVGLVFGIYPAQKAAKLDPISALRYE